MSHKKLIHSSTHKISHLALTVAGTALLAAAFPAIAQAGFEWTPPAKAPIAPAAEQMGGLMPEMPALPRDVVETVDMSVMTATPIPPAPAYHDVQDFGQGEDAPRFSSRLTRQVTMEERVSPHISSAMAEESRMTVTRAAPSAYEEAIGFGSDLPLVMAMRQIVPPQYAYSFSGAVDQGVRVDWNGGKPWDAVLQDAIRPQGLALSISGQVVHIFPAGQSPLPVSSPASVAPPMMAARAEVQETASSQEVYIRRNAPAGPITLTPDNTKKAKESSSFWSRLGLTSNETTTIASADKTALRQDALAPRPPMDSQQADMAQGEPGLIARLHKAQLEEASIYNTEFHDAQRYEAEINAPISLTQVPPENVSQLGNIYMMDFWQAEKGDSLHRVLQSWSNRAGVQLHWTAPSDYALIAPVRLQGSYTDVLSQVLGAYDDSASRPLGRLHPNLPTGPSVLVIESSNNS